MSTEVIFWPAMPVVKHCAEVKACKLLCGNLTLIYTSSFSSSSHQRMKGCLGEHHITLWRTRSITACFAAYQQGENPSFVSHLPGPSWGRSTAQNPTSAHTCLLGSKTYARDRFPTLGRAAPILQVQCEMGRVDCLLLELS